MERRIFLDFFFQRKVEFASKLAFSSFQSVFNQNFKRIHDANGSRYSYNFDKDKNKIEIGRANTVRNRPHLYPRLVIRLIDKSQTACSVSVKFIGGVNWLAIIIPALTILTILSLAFSFPNGNFSLSWLHNPKSFRQIGVLLASFIPAIILKLLSSFWQAQECLYLRASAEEIFELSADRISAFKLPKQNAAEELSSIGFETLPETFEATSTFQLKQLRHYGFLHLYFGCGLLSGFILLRVLANSGIPGMAIVLTTLLISMGIYYFQHLRLPLFSISPKGIKTKKSGNISWKSFKSVDVVTASNTISIHTSNGTETLSEATSKYNKYEMAEIIRRYEKKYKLAKP